MQVFPVSGTLGELSSFGKDWEALGNRLQQPLPSKDARAGAEVELEEASVMSGLRGHLSWLSGRALPGCWRSGESRSSPLIVCMCVCVVILDTFQQSFRKSSFQVKLQKEEFSLVVVEELVLWWCLGHFLIPQICV